jgi:hypothetical protein
MRLKTYRAPLCAVALLLLVSVAAVFLAPDRDSRDSSSSQAGPVSVPQTGETESRKETDSAPSSLQVAAKTLTRNNGEASGSTGSHFIPVEKRPAPDPSESPVTSPVLAPRTALPKEPLLIPRGEDIEITVKFRDALLARAQSDGALSIVEGVINDLGTVALSAPIFFEPAFDPISTEKLRDLQKRAAEGSGTMQPDFEGTLVVKLLRESSRDERIEVARAFHRLEEVEYVELAALDNPTPPPGDIAPPTPNLTNLQTYRNSEAASGGVDAAYAFSRGIRGQGIRISDCEYGFNASHEDLVDSDITDSSRGPFYPTVITNGWDKHGTAAIGISGATENAYGATGIAAAAEIHFYSEWTENGARRRESVTDAIADSAFGDVVLLEMQTGDGQGNYVPAEYSSTIWSLVKAGSDAGVIVVAAAGNGGANLDDAYYDAYHLRGDSGSIIIGAGDQNSNHTRKGFSTHGERVNVQAWGGGVFSTGYGSHATYGGDINQRYTSGFSGTSSASAIAAPSVAVIQSYCEQVLGYRLGPIQMRALVEGTGIHPATDQKIGPHINIRNAMLNFAPVTNFTCSDNLPDRVVASWSGTAPATAYQVYRGETVDPLDAVLLGTNQGQLEWTDSSIPPGASRYYFVRPVTPYGPGEWSTPVEGSSVGFQIDLTEASDTGASQSDGITSDSTPEISGVSAPNTPLTITSNLDGDVGTASADQGGAWTTTLNELSEGTHQLIAREEEGRASVPLTVVIDLTPPASPTQLSLHPADDTGLHDDDGITRNISPRIIGQTEVPVEVELFLGAQSHGTVSSDGSFTMRAMDLSDSVYPLSACCIDLAGNKSAPLEGPALTIDTVLPAGVIRRTQGQAVSASSGPIDFDISFQEAVTGLTRSDIEVGGSSPGAGVSVGSGPTTFLVRVINASAEGPVFVSVLENSYADLAGNEGPAMIGAADPVYVDFDGISLLDLDATGSGSVEAWLLPDDLDGFQFEMDRAQHLRISIAEFGDLIQSIRNLDGVEFFKRTLSTGATATDEEIALPRGTYILELSDPDGLDSGFYELNLEGGEDAVSKPDSRIGKSMSASVGNNVYRTPAGQTYLLKSKKARTVKGFLAVENDGDFLESCRIGAGRGNLLFRVTHYSGGRNVTAALSVFQHSTPWLAPGGPAATIQTTVKPSKRKLIRKTPRGGKKYLRKTLRLSYIIAGIGGGSDYSAFEVKTR